MDEPEAVALAFGAAREAFEGVARDAVLAGGAGEAEHGTGVLDGVVGVVEHGADAADIGAHGMRHHFVEPVGGEDLEVVVEEGEDRSFGGADGEIVDRGEIERRVVG